MTAEKTGRGIMIVDDDENDNFMLVRQMKKAGIRDLISVFTNAEDALDHLLSSSDVPAVILLDMHLPAMNGVDLLTLIRDQTKLKDIPTFMMTGFMDSKSSEECDKQGIVAYLIKPILLTKIIRTLSYLRTIAHSLPKFAK